MPSARYLPTNIFSPMPRAADAEPQMPAATLTAINNWKIGGPGILSNEAIMVEYPLVAAVTDPNPTRTQTFKITIMEFLIPSVKVLARLVCSALRAGARMIRAAKTAIARETTAFSLNPFRATNKIMEGSSQTKRLILGTFPVAIASDVDTEEISAPVGIKCSPLLSLLVRAWRI